MDAFIRSSRRCEAFDEGGAEIRRIVLIEKCLALGESRLTISLDIDVVVERVAEPSGIAPFLARHFKDPAPLPLELRRRDFIGHPAVGVACDAPEAPLDDFVCGTSAVFPGKAGGVAGNPDRAG